MNIYNVTCLAGKSIACKNCGLSLLLTASDISPGGILKNMKSVSKGAPNINLFNFMFFLVDFCKNVCSLADKLQQNSNASVKEG